MNTLFLLLVLTHQDPATDIKASFVNAASQQECLNTKQAVSTILDNRKIKHTAECLENPHNTQFEKFQHQPATAGTQTDHAHYLLNINNNQLAITAYADGQQCQNTPPPPKIKTRKTIAYFPARKLSINPQLSAH